MLTNDYVLSVNDVYNVVAEHLTALDTLWPDAEHSGPRKVHIVELIDAIKLKLCMVADKNQNRYESPFERAAKKITGTNKLPPPREKQEAPVDTGKSSMQLAHEAAQARIRNR